MKHPFKLSKANIIYGLTALAVSLLINIRIHGIGSSYSLGIAVGTIITLILFPTFFALLFWYILGRKEYGGTTTFNIVLTLMLFGSLSEFGRISKEREK